MTRVVTDEAPERTHRSFARTLLGGLIEIFVVLAMALVLSLVIKTFLVQAFRIPSQSMENTLLVGDRVIVSKMTPGPFELHRGDVVVFKDPGHWLDTPTPVADSGLHAVLTKTLTFVGLLPTEADQHLIKRVIGMPGDTVACCDAQGRLTVNGTPIEEAYVYPGDAASAKSFSATVPANSLWVMGDHRSVSWDSRYHEGNSFVPIDDVVGKAFLIVWPFDRFSRVTSSGSAFANVK